MRIVVVAAGELGPVDDLRNVLAGTDESQLVIAADGGLHHCDPLGLTPDLVVGDMDSVAASQLSRAEQDGTELIRHDPDKDETDLELALSVALERGADELAALEIVVVAPFGGRIDHELANVALLAAARLSPVAVSAVDGRRSMHVLRPGDSLDLAVEPGTTISLLPWGGDVGGVTAEGVRWPLVDEPLLAGRARGVSNRAVASTQRIQIATGVLLVVVGQIED